MVERKRRDVSRAAIGSLLLLGAYAGCHPDFDALSAGSDEAGNGGAGASGAMAGRGGAGGATGAADPGGEGGESAGVGGIGTGGTGTGGTGTGGTGKGGTGKGGTGTSGRGGFGGDAGSGGEGGDEGGTGTGGDAGAGGVNGGAGAGGAGASGGGAGAGGAGGQAGGCMEGTAGMAGGVTATGVEVLTVPLMTVGEGQRFNVQNRTNPSMPFDMSGATLTVRAYAPCALGGNLSIFFRSTSVTESPSMKVGLSTLVDGFVDIEVPVPAATGSFDPVLVDIIRIEIEADAAFGSTFRSPATVVYIDSVTSSNGAVTHPFDTMPTFLDFGDSGFRPLPGSTNVWRAQYP